MGLMSEYIQKRMSGNQLEEELLKYIGLYNQIRDTHLIVYSSAFTKQVPGNILIMDDYYTIFDMLKNVESKNLDFYIETPGGSGEAAEEIVRFIRSKFDNVTFVVSGEAKSAGTLIVLSGNEILMTRSGSLGPIDAQVKIGRSVISAYDYCEWIENKRDEAEKMGGLNPFDATMIAQISPGELSGVSHSLEFAKDLVVEWLAKYKFKDWVVTDTQGLTVTDEMRNQRAKDIAKCLTNHGKWRSHGRSLKIDDLENIGLRITKVDDDTNLSEIVYRIHTIIRLLFSSISAYKIFADDNKKIFVNATPAGDIHKIPSGNVDVVEVETKCQKCGQTHKLYAKFTDDNKIDEDFEKKNFKSFPPNNKLICDCGFEIDLSGIRNEIETKFGKKIMVQEEIEI
jgi:Serine dehydrogenase proteinase